MKKNYILLIFLFSISLIAQTKSSGVVNLGTRMTINVEKNNTTSKAKFTITGPSDRWFAVSYRDSGGSIFNQDCIIVNSTTAVSDALFPGGSAATIDANQDITVLSNTVAGTVRTIVVERNFASNEPYDYLIWYDDNAMDLSWAIAPSATFNIALKHLNSTTLDRSFSSLNFTILDNKSFDKKLESLVVYPNPIQDILHLKNDNQLTISTVKIYNTNAQLIKEINLNSNKNSLILDVSNLTTGTYFLEISNDLDKSIKKIQKK